MQSVIQFNSIDHITLVVANLENTRSFYCDILGMEQVPRPDFDFEGIWLHDHQPTNNTTIQAMIHIILENELAGGAGWGDRKTMRLTRGHHFAFQVDNAIAAFEYLKRKGVEIAIEPNQRPDGPTKFCVQDPDGHVIEFYSLPNG